MRRSFLQPSTLLALYACGQPAWVQVHDNGVSSPLSQCGSSWDAVPVDSGSPTATQGLARPVGHLGITLSPPQDIDGDGILDSAAVMCSGALISPELFLTAGHCFDVDAKMRRLLPTASTPADVCAAAFVVFDDRVDLTPTVPFNCDSLVAQSHTGDEDWAVMRLLPNGTTYPSDLIGTHEPRIEYDALSASASVGLISHPDGRPLEASTDTVDSMKTWKFTHRNDTQGGSSGGPMFDAAGTIVGIQVIGACTIAGLLDHNRAERMDMIALTAPELMELDWFDQRQSDTLVAGDHFGEVLALGDFDADGYDDLVIGAPADARPLPGTGSITVRSGSSQGLLISTENSFGRIGSGSTTADAFGTALATGDFDGDGFDDLVASAPLVDAPLGLGTGVGELRLFPGATTGLGSLNIPIDAASLGHAYLSGASLGEALAVGDFNGDGLDDLAVGAPGEAPSGAVYVVLGDGAGLGSGITTRIARSDLVTSLGSGSSGARFGSALTAGDFDNDGFDDLAIGSPLEDVTGSGVEEGAVFVAFGTPEMSGVATSGAIGFSSQVLDANALDHYGQVLASGDVDGDGFDDLVIGAPDSGGPGTVRPEHSGLVEVAFGRPLLALAGFTTVEVLLPFDAGLTADVGDAFGAHLAVGEADGDGREELFIGIPGLDETMNDDGAIARFDGQTSKTFIHWGQHDFAGHAGQQTNDRVGTTFALGFTDLDADAELVVGFPFRRVGAFATGPVSEAGAVAIYPIIP